MSPPCQFYNTGFIHFNLNYIYLLIDAPTQRALYLNVTVRYAKCNLHTKLSFTQRLSESLHNLGMYFGLNHCPACHQILNFNYFFSTFPRTPPPQLCLWTASYTFFIKFVFSRMTSTLGKVTKKLGIESIASPQDFTRWDLDLETRWWFMLTHAQNGSSLLWHASNHPSPL